MSQVEVSDPYPPLRSGREDLRARKYKAVISEHPDPAMIGTDDGCLAYAFEVRARETSFGKCVKNWTAR